jgi:predicted methyltransferase
VSEKMFAEFYRVLKPDGVLGIVDHRAGINAEAKEALEKGYIHESRIIQLAVAQGFAFSDSSEINANPSDTKDYLKGVWALPPTLTDTGANVRKFLSIGESDRMTLRFRKPRMIGAN